MKTEEELRNKIKDIDEEIERIQTELNDGRSEYATYKLGSTLRLIEIKHQKEVINWVLE